MPKFQSIVVKEEKKNKNGEIIEGGEIVFVPLDDASMLEPICDKALSAGKIINPLTGQAYTEAEFRKKQAEIRVVLKARETEATRRRPQF